MRTVEAVRRARLALLVEEFGGYAALNKLRGKEPRDSTLSQYAGQTPGSKSKTAKPKEMGSPVARDLERVCNKEPGWMDTDPSLWPFLEIDHGKLQALAERHIHMLEGALIGAAVQLGLDIQKGAAA